MIDREADKKQSFYTFLDYAALGAALHFFLWGFLKSTMFKFQYDDLFKTITFSLVVVLGTLKLLTGIWNDGMLTSEVKEKRSLLIKELLAVAMIIPCTNITQQFGYNTFVYMPFVAFCFYGNDIKKVLKVFTACFSLVLGATVLSALSGSIVNLLYYRAENGARIRGAYGICYPTDCATYFLFLFMYFWICRQRNNWGNTILFAAFAALLAYGILYYTDSRTSFSCGILLVVMIVYHRLNEDVFSRHKGTSVITKTVDFLTIGAFPIAGAAMFALTWMYGAGNSFAQKANIWMSTRLELMWNTFQEYGINAFGAMISQNGRGGKAIYGEGTYQFLDSSYALLLIRYGWVLFLAIAILWVWMTRKAIRSGHRTVALAMALIAFHSFSEHHLVEYHINFLLAMPLCCFLPEPDCLKKTEIRKGDVSGWITGGIVALAFVLLLPRLLSMMRTVVNLQDWTALTWQSTGERSQFSLYAWLLLLGVIAGIWYALHKILQGWHKNRKVNRTALAVLALLIGLTAAGVITVNGQVSQALPQYEKRISAEREAVEMILGAAKEPVYANQEEEIYKRNFNGIKDRILSAEEYSRIGKGSFILEHDNEGYLLIKTGAKYTELSADSGLFTYDEAVIEKLSGAGYHFTKYYSAERKVNIASFAEMNKLETTEQGGLILHGKKQSLRFGPYLEQYAGNYIVTFKLRLINKDLLSEKDREICTLRASSMSGKNIRQEKVIHAGDFDETGCLVSDVDYNVTDTRNVEYLVFTRDKIDLIVEEITWKRKQR